MSQLSGEAHCTLSTIILRHQLNIFTLTSNCELLICSVLCCVCLFDNMHHYYKSWSYAISALWTWSTHMCTHCKNSGIGSSPEKLMESLNNNTNLKKGPGMVKAWFCYLFQYRVINNGSPLIDTIWCRRSDISLQISDTRMVQVYGRNKRQWG